MRQLTLLLFLHHSLAEFFDLEKCVIDYRSLENMWETKLAHDLRDCGYDIYKPPAQNASAPIQVQMKFALKNFKYSSEEQQFSAFTWTILGWYDERLKWNPKDYDGIDSVVLTSYKIWVPSIRHINSIHEIYDRRYYSIPCDVSSLGFVRCIALEEYKAECGTNLSDWPYDAQTCKLEFGLYAEEGAKIQLEVGPRAITMISADYGTEWDIMDYQQEEDHTSDKQLIMTFRLERHADVLAAIVVYPSIILSVLTLSTLLIDPRRQIRLYMICFSLMCQFYSQSDLVWEIPKHSNDPPRILLYYRGSFIMTSILVVLSLVLNFICRKMTTCYNWIIAFNDFVFTKFVKFLIWPRWYSSAEEDITTSKLIKYWIDFANIVNSVWIVVSVIVYIILYCVFMPQPIPIVY